MASNDQYSDKQYYSSILMDKWYEHKQQPELDYIYMLVM